jgi:hypothetical protein
VACIVNTTLVLAARPPPWCTLVMAGRMRQRLAIAVRRSTLEACVGSVLDGPFDKGPRVAFWINDPHKANTPRLVQRWSCMFGTDCPSYL